MSELDRWNSRFSAEDYVFGTEPNAFLARHRDRLKPGQRALAVADGEGRNGTFMAELGLDVLSVDFSAAALAKAARLAAARSVALRTEQTDLLSWTWPTGHFDVVVAIFIQFADPAARQRIFDGIKLSLRSGGLLLLQGYRPEQLAYGTGGPRIEANLYTRDLLEAAFGDFEILELGEHDSVISEGVGHAGMSALIDLVARKPAES